MDENKPKSKCTPAQLEALKRGREKRHREYALKKLAEAQKKVVNQGYDLSAVQAAIQIANSPPPSVSVDPPVVEISCNEEGICKVSLEHNKEPKVIEEDDEPVEVKPKLTKFQRIINFIKVVVISSIVGNALRVYYPF